MTSISDIADRAADILETQGHIKHDWGEDGGPRCLGGAMSQATRELNGNSSVAPACPGYGDTSTAVEQMLQCNFIDWNNAPERKPEEVIQVLRDVAIKHRPDEMRG